MGINEWSLEQIERDSIFSVIKTHIRHIWTSLLRGLVPRESAVCRVGI